MFMELTITINLNNEMEIEMAKITALPESQQTEMAAIEAHISEIGKLVDDTIEEAVLALNGAGYIAALADQ